MDMTQIWAGIGSVIIFVIGWLVKSPLASQVEKEIAIHIGDIFETLIAKSKDPNLTTLEANMLITVGKQFVEVGENVLKKKEQVVIVQTPIAPVATSALN